MCEGNSIENFDSRLSLIVEMGGVENRETLEDVLDRFLPSVRVLTFEVKVRLIFLLTYLLVFLVANFIELNKAIDLFHYFLEYL